MCINIVSLNAAASPSEDSYKNGEIIEFGMYPQTKITDQSLIDVLSGISATTKWESYGYYWDSTRQDYMEYCDIDYNGIKYRGVFMTKNRPDTTYENEYGGHQIQKSKGYVVNTQYWFKYEPLQWIVINADSGLLLSKYTIDGQAFSDTLFGSSNNQEQTIPANDYGTSSIRKWLNTTFCDTAFSKDQKDMIACSSITNNGYNKQDEPFLHDKLFLLSANEVTSDVWDTKVTDYGASQGTENNWWRLRDAGSGANAKCGDSGSRAVFDYGGGGWNMSPARICDGIRPALHMERSYAHGFANANCVFGTFQSSDASNVTIDGKTYPYKSGLVISQETYQGKLVRCALEDATVTSIQLAESVTGVWSAYNSSTGLMTIGGKSYTISPEIDSTWFLGSADAMIGTQVTAIVIGSEIYHLDSDDTTVTGKLSALDGSSLTLDGKTYYCASDAIGRSKISVGQRVQCLLKKGVIQEIRVAGVVTGSLDASDSAAKTVMIGNTVYKTTEDFDFGSLPAIGTFVVCRTLDGVASAAYTKEQTVVPTASAHASGNLSYSDGAYQKTASVHISFAAVPMHGFSAEELAGIYGLKTDFGDVTVSGDNMLSLDSSSIVRSRTIRVGVLDPGDEKTADFCVSGDTTNMPTDKESSKAGIDVTESDGQVLCACIVPVCNLDFQRMQAEKKKAASEAGKKAAALKKAYDSSSTITVDLKGALPNLTAKQREAAEEYLQSWSTTVTAIYTENAENKNSIDKKLYDKLLGKLGIDPKLTAFITPTTVKASTVVSFNGGKEQYRFKLTGPFVSSAMYLTMTMQNVSGGDETPVGSVCYTNIDQFCSALEDILDDATKNAYDELYSTGINEMADMCLNKTLLTLINAKYGNFSDAVYDVTIRGEERSLKKCQVNCPVDVYVYDSSNMLCGKIVDNVVDSSLTGLNMYVEDDSKIVYLAGDDYHIKLVGSDSGTMSCSVTEYGGDMSELRTVTMVNVPLTKGSEYGSYVDEKPNQASSLYQLYDKSGSAVGELQDTAPSSLKVTNEAVSGSKAKLTLSATIGRDDPGKACRVIVAAYDENGKLLATGTTALTGDGTAYCVISTDLSCNIPADRKLRLSVFALDSESTTPVCAAQTLLYEVGA